jgi:hypothetical protein
VEDIGPADTLMPLRIEDLISVQWTSRFAGLIGMAAEESDHYVNENQPKPDSEDFAIVLDDAKDKHMVDGRNMGRKGKVGEEHFWTRVAYWRTGRMMRISKRR